VTFKPIASFTAASGTPKMVLSCLLTRKSQRLGSRPETCLDNLMLVFTAVDCIRRDGQNGGSDTSARSSWDMTRLSSWDVGSLI